MPKLYSYVVDHDHGFAPNPYNQMCTLVHCKFGGQYGRSNIVEGANIGDWILGTGGSGESSAGHGKIIYLMRVDEKLDFNSYINDDRFQGRSDHMDDGAYNLYALISHHYFYFGRNAFHIDALPIHVQSKCLIKSGQGYRYDYPEELVAEFASWFENTYIVGMHGNPCDPLEIQNGDDQSNSKPAVQYGKCGSDC